MATRAGMHGQGRGHGRRDGAGDGPASRARMIEAAIDLMRASGLSGAGINEIVRASAAPKGSVYHFFPGGKEQIVTEALLEYAPRVARFMEGALADGRTPAARVRRLFEAFGRRVQDADFCRSCAFGTVSLDLEGEHEALRQVIGATFEGWSALIAQYVDAGSAGRSRAVAGLILTAIEGAYIRARAERTSRPFIEAGELLAELVAAEPVTKSRAAARKRRSTQTPR